MTPPAAALSSTGESMRRALDLCIAKTRTNIQALADRPAAWALAVNGRYPEWKEGFMDIGNWTSSFFTGMALLAWRETGDEHFLHQAVRLEPCYQAKLQEHAADTMHDLGFLYSLYAVALHKLTGESRYRELGLHAARLLAGRFIPQGNYIRAWGRMDRPDCDYAGLAIIDSMMNLPLLYWAAAQTGDPFHADIAVRHSETTLLHFVRPDGSLYHSYRFEPESGAPRGGDNYCGRSIESQWARGAAWATYGFALGHRYTGDRRYLDTALRLARNFISQLDSDAIPFWDFRLDDEAPRIRDSSAAAVAVCAFQELEALGFSELPLSAAKYALLARLCSDTYLDADRAAHGILRYGEVGDGRGGAKSAYTSWGDYFLMEALTREIGKGASWW